MDDRDVISVLCFAFLCALGGFAAGVYYVSRDRRVDQLASSVSRLDWTLSERIGKLEHPEPAKAA